MVNPARVDDNQIAWSFVMLLIKEVAERFLRLQKYVEEAEIGVGRRRPQLIEYIRSSVKERLWGLKDSWRLAQRAKNEYDLEKAASALIVATAPLEGFKKLHEALRWFYTPWAEAETETFLRELFDSPLSQKLFEELNICVGFTEEYDFMHPYQAEQFGAKRSDTPNVIALPRIEKNNPLMWPVLVHEVGHAVVLARRIDQAVEAEIHKDASEGQISTLQQWCRELSSDLFALKLLGPSYLLAYLNYYTFIFHEPRTAIYAFHRASNDTPSPVSRIEFLWGQLEAMDHRFLRSTPTSGPLKFYKQLFETRLRLEVKRREYDYSPPSIQVGPEISDSLYGRLQQLVKKEVENHFRALDLKSFSFDDDLSQAMNLKSRFARKELISSWQNDSALRTEVERWEAGLCGLSAVYMKLQETPCSPSQIVNAGWFARLEHELDVFSREEADTDLSLMEEIEEVDYRCRLLQKSIETAAIHRFFALGEVSRTDRGGLT